MLKTLEKFHIYNETKNNNQLNDSNTVTPNAILDTSTEHAEYNYHFHLLFSHPLDVRTNNNRTVQPYEQNRDPATVNRK
jgi:hypothetical protein